MPGEVCGCKAGKSLIVRGKTIQGIRGLEKTVSEIRHV